MLVIRQEQMDTLIKGTDEEWVETLLKETKESDPDISKKYDDDALRRMVRIAIKKAERYGFTPAKDQASFVSIMFEVAPNFDEQDEIRTGSGLTMTTAVPTFMNCRRFAGRASPRRAAWADTSWSSPAESSAR